MLKYLITLLLAFSITSSALADNAPLGKLSESIQSVVIGPDAGEYGYELTLITREGEKKPINSYFSDPTKPAMIGVIEKIKRDYPNLKKIALSIGWYSNTIKAEKITIRPKVKRRAGPEWAVAGYTRETAEKIATDKNGDIIWEGTPTDSSYVELCNLLNKAGFEVTFYPFIFINIPSQPAREEIKAISDEGVANFLEEYNKYILHYANLEHNGVKLKDVIKGFIIGSELEGMTQYRSPKTQEFIFVNGLVDLAAKARAILGPNIRISYAANWSEYHSTETKWHHLDKLWQDKNIDYVGIDAYLPLVPPKVKSKDLTVDEITKGWESGENYDYDPDDKKKALNPADAIKNLKYWWANYHVNPDGSITGWMPKMKPIIFTEIGFTAVDHTTTDPSNYIDTSKKDRGLPRGSNGKINQKFQYDGILGTINFIKKINNEPETKGMIADAYWYFIDPLGHGYDWINNHELKISEVERGEFDKNGKWKGVKVKAKP